MSARSRILLLALLATVIVITGCATQQLPYAMASESSMPDFVHSAPAHVRDAYRFAAANPREMEKYPCYCGCVHLGHTSARACFVKKIDAAGLITFDNHASGCGICVDITLDVMRLLREGKSSPEIRTYIDATYSQSGPSTNTPLPAA
ncbi:MAG: PCYCGC motif-containing (lipo)protein [Anaerolineae bacterium]